MVHFNQHENLLFLKEIIMPPRSDYDAICLVSKFVKTDLNTLFARCPGYFTSANILCIMYAMVCFALVVDVVIYTVLPKPSPLCFFSDERPLRNAFSKCDAQRFEAC